MKIETTVESDASNSVRSRQVRSMFDLPDRIRQERAWSIRADLDQHWSVGLILGPSGSGKTTILKSFGEVRLPEWSAASVIDDFDERLSIKEVTDACGAVGFNTIPAWLRRYDTLSNGEQFRVTLARLLAEGDTCNPILIDEFTSVVDRQVAKIASYALGRYARKHDQQVIVASCHEDVLDWLQPDWVIEPAIEAFNWRSVQPRPKIEVEVGPCELAEWRRFAPFHYLSTDLARSARTFALWVDHEPVSFCGVLHRPVSKPQRTGQNLMGISRVVTLPDWQGVGLAFALINSVGAAYKALGKRLNNYPAHPAFIRAHDRSPSWELLAKPGLALTQRGGTDRASRPAKLIKAWQEGSGGRANSIMQKWKAGVRPCATFRYIGPAMDELDATSIMRPYIKLNDQEDLFDQAS